MLLTVARSYEILSDPNERATYDQYGLDGPGGRGGHSHEGMDASDLFASMFGGGGGGFDPFGGMGGGGGGGRRPARSEDQVSGVSSI